MIFITYGLKFLTKLPVIKSVNSILGGVLGGVYGILIIYILLALLAFSAAFGSESALIKSVNESYVGAELYENNFIVDFISGK